MTQVGGIMGKWTSTLAMIGIVASAAWLTPSRQNVRAWEHSTSSPLLARGYTDATAGTVVIPADPAGGMTVLELHIKDGQSVRRNDIIAVLSNYARAETLVRIADVNLEKVKRLRETMLTGSRLTSIVMQEKGVKMTISGTKAEALQRQRSGKPPDQKELEISIAERNLEYQKGWVEVMKRMLANDLALNQVDIASAEAALEIARADREASLVRSPIDGVVTEIYSRKGELFTSRLGIAKVVDMRQLRVLAEVDELHLPRLLPGARVEVTFRGSSRVYPGRVVRTPMTVTRVKRSPTDLGQASAHSVDAEIEFDDPSSVPQMLDREARIIFL
jgi:multidrug resistance efflux pump